MKLALGILLLAASTSACSPNASSPSPAAPLGIDAYELVDVTVVNGDFVSTHYDLEPDSWGTDYIRFRYARPDVRTTKREEFVILPVSLIRAVRVPRLDESGAPLVLNPIDAAKAEREALSQGYIDD